MPIDTDPIKVVIRFKGREDLTPEEFKQWSFATDGKGLFTPESGKEKKRQYTFDHVLVENTQERMYRYAAKETVVKFTQGFNGTIFAYGQSGSGKTFSMLGPEEVVEIIKSGEQIPQEV